MLNEGLNEINNLNKEFYEKHNESFDKSRFMEWQGFFETLDFINENSTILDVGCGNGRFLEFLIKNNIKFKSYLGIDNSPEFIEKNRLKYLEHQFEVVDVITKIEDVKENYDIVLLFGVTHHIPYEEYRRDWFNKIKNLVSKNGVLAVSFWEFDPKKEDKEFRTKVYRPQEGDYFLGWKDNYDYHRFCHLFSEKELSGIIKVFSNFEVIKEFNQDKNKYLIFKRLS